MFVAFVKLIQSGELRSRVTVAGRDDGPQFEDSVTVVLGPGTIPAMELGYPIRFV